MPTYEVKSRKTGPITVSTVEAETREQAITQTRGRGCGRRDRRGDAGDRDGT